jgi:magnesium transporter
MRIRRQSVGQPPGSLTNEASAEPSRIHVITYNQSGVEETNVEVAADGSFPELPAEPEEGVRWVNVVGVQNGSFLQELGRRFSVHPLMLEDVQHTDQRPKLQDGGSTLFLVIRMISWNGEEGSLETEQVSMFSSGRTVISFQERQGDVLEGLRERIRRGKGRVRRSPADYLVYAILDAVVDSSFLAADELQASVEELEADIIHEPGEELLSRVHKLRGEVITLRRAIWPLREMLQLPSKGQNEFFNVETLPFLQDTYDHVLSLIDTIDSQRDRVTGLFQLHSSMVGASTNEIMRTLTIIATIFIPLTFVAGIYGMNFVHMPELQWRYGYPTLLGVMLVIAGGMIYYFRKRRWF